MLISSKRAIIAIIILALPPLGCKQLLAPQKPAEPTTSVTAPTKTAEPTAPAVPTQPAEGTRAPVIDGLYQAAGTNPGGESYKGTVQITSKNDLYQLQWSVGRNYSGVGLLLDNVLAVGWGHTNKPGYGVMAYEVSHPYRNTMSGTWAAEDANGIGAEDLVVMGATSSVTTDINLTQNNAKLGGTYAVTGKNPGGQVGYHGKLTITPKGNLYQLKWSVGTSYTGVGIRSGNIFAVGWGNAGRPGYGVVAYRIADDGTLTGSWTGPTGGALGIETATPQK